MKLKAMNVDDEPMSRNQDNTLVIEGKVITITKSHRSEVMSRIKGV